MNPILDVGYNWSSGLLKEAQLILTGGQNDYCVLKFVYGADSFQVSEEQLILSSYPRLTKTREGLEPTEEMLHTAGYLETCVEWVKLAP